MKYRVTAKTAKNTPRTAAATKIRKRSPQVNDFRAESERRERELWKAFATQTNRVPLVAKKARGDLKLIERLTRRLTNLLDTIESEA